MKALKSQFVPGHGVDGHLRVRPEELVTSSEELIDEMLQELQILPTGGPQPARAK
ncbi:hypothetical protein ACIHFD_64080 [Nonomuraea sp. NPDC051941]|uniref:hypothetical protein n=1 Tax=Nonomuraea sp. NPDC051941 TaxID=3364373 RepID=UPI0037CA6886